MSAIYSMAPLGRPTLARRPTSAPPNRRESGVRHLLQDLQFARRSFSRTPSVVIGQRLRETAREWRFGAVVGGAMLVCGGEATLAAGRDAPDASTDESRV